MERLLWEVRAAQESPARPDPMTMTSAEVGVGSFFLRLSNAFRLDLDLDLDSVCGGMVEVEDEVGRTKDVVGVGTANPRMDASAKDHFAILVF